MTKKQIRYCVNCKEQIQHGTHNKECSLRCIFEHRIKKENDCWIWKGLFFKSTGYGRIKIDGIGTMVHRASYIFHKGEIEKGMCVLHICDNRLCINPMHLFLGDRKDNYKDMRSKKREACFKGSRNSQAILNEKSVLEIRDRHEKGEKVKDLANEFKIKYQSCLDVVSRRNWRHI